MPDRSKGRGLTKCSVWSSGLGVGLTTTNQKTFTVTKPYRGYGGDQGFLRVVRASKEERRRIKTLQNNGFNFD
jgi:hypothetical protein